MDQILGADQGEIPTSKSIASYGCLVENAVQTRRGLGIMSLALTDDDECRADDGSDAGAKRGDPYYDRCSKTTIGRDGCDRGSDKGNRWNPKR